MRIETDDKESKLSFFQDLYTTARSACDSQFEMIERNMKQYKGDNEIDGSVEKATVVRNITYELVESQVSGYIPTAKVEPVTYSRKTECNAKNVENMLSKKRNELPFVKMNDIDERYNPIYGGSVWLIEWDNSIVTHNTVGDVKISCLSPANFVGQPKIYDVKDMEYCFIKFETTREDIVRRYGVDIDTADEAISEDPAETDDTATLIVCYYKDDNDKVCQYVWSGDTELLDVEDYFARKRYVCKKCGKRKEICTCEDGEYELMNEEYEELDEDIALSDGTVIPAMSQVIENGMVKTKTEYKQAIDSGGNVMMDIVNGMPLPKMTAIQVPVMEKTKLPFYTPNILPIVIRKNTSQENSLLGQSDCEFIRPQQQTINKIESRIAQKLIRAGITPVVPEDASVSLNNSVFGQVIKLKPGESMSQYGRIDTTPDVSQDLAEAERLYDHAKRLLGISDSFQGQYDPSAQSGKAKQMQINQAAGRLDSKRRMKNAAYAEIDQIIFQLYLAYSDEPRPAVYIDELGFRQNSTFNRYDFIERDEAGEYYYNDEYIFSADASIDVERSRELMWQETRNNLREGAYGNPQNLETLLIFWLNMEKSHYPGAHENVERFRREIERQAQMAQLQQQNQQMAEEINNRIGYENYLRGEANK